MAIDFGKQVGPLPLGAWIATVGGGIGVVVWRRRGTSTSPTPVANTMGDPNVGTGPGWTAVVPPSTAPNTSPGTVFLTNQDWAVAAINYLVAKGFDAAIASGAITKALNQGIGSDGSGMTVQETLLYSMAIAALGSPPMPVNVPQPPGMPGPVTTPNPPPPTPTAPPQQTAANYRYYVVQSGDTLQKLAFGAYGNLNLWDKIFEANRADRIRADGTRGMLIFPSLILPGMKLVIPN